MADFRLPPPGRLVPVGGRRLHVQMMGEGSPAVVLEAGLLSTSLLWARVLPAVARFTRVIAYDRAGYAWSDPGPAPRTAGAAVSDLRELLRALDVRGPLVVAGHSYGGLVARLFAGQRGSDVAGLVLFDPSDPDQFSRAGGNVRVQTRLISALPVLARLGLLWLLSYGPLFPLIGAIPELPPRERQLVRRLMRVPGHFEAALAEWRVLAESFRQVRSAPLPRDLLLTVVSAGDTALVPLDGVLPAEFRSGMHQLHAALVARVPGAQHIIASGIDHARIAGATPEAAQLAVRVIRKMVEEVRGGN